MTDITNSRAYTSLAQANDRLALLSRCNTNATEYETLRGGENAEIGCQWCSWTLPGEKDPEIQFFAEVKRLLVRGVVVRRNVLEEEKMGVGEGPAPKEDARVNLEFARDKAGCVWVVSVCRPEVEGVGAGTPKGLIWEVDGAVATQGQAMARDECFQLLSHGNLSVDIIFSAAFRIWSDTFHRHEGPFEMLNFHYGMARWVLVPMTAVADLPRPATGSSELHRDLAAGVPQIRLERVELTPEEGLLDVGLPPQAVMYEKPFIPLRSEAQKVEGDLRGLMEAAGERV